MLRALCAFVCVVVASGCTSTRLTEVWKSPDAPAKLTFDKIVVACFFADEVSRRAAEDELVARIGPDKATPSYELISLGEAKDVDALKAVVDKEHFDGALVMRLVGVDKERAWVPGTAGPPGYYDSFYGYYSYSWGRTYDTGRYETDTIVKIETVIYSLEGGEQMIWAAQSETFNPNSVTQTVKEIANAVGKSLRREGLID